MATRVTSSSSLTPNIGPLIRIGLLANTFEWYEFSIFGLLATHMSHVFFPHDVPSIGLIKTFGLFAVSYFARPLGSIFFGFVSDHISRKVALRLSLVLMAIPTLLIGFLPSFSQVGIVASISLVLLRLLQGFAAGGELSTSACYIFEASSHFPRRSLICVCISIGQTLGILLGSLVITLVSWMTSAEVLEAWAWRIPFWLSMPLTLFIFMVRKSIEETPLKSISTTPTPLTKPDGATAWEMIRYPFLQGALILSFLIGSYYVIAFWMPTYLIHFLNVPPQIARLTNSITLMMIVVFYVLMGHLSSRWGYVRVIKGCIVTILLLLLPVFKLLVSATTFSTLLGLQLILALFMSSTGLFVEMLGHAFEPAYRNIGMSLTMTIPATLIGGITPLICSYGIQKTGSLLFPAYYLIGLGLIALPFAMQLSVTRNRSG